jgi:hypothetical protein
MKKITSILVILSFVLSCGPNNLDKKTAEELIVKKHQYPKVISCYIFRADPGHARELIEEGLEKRGYVSVKQTLKLKDVGTPLVYFTNSAKPYLLESTAEDKKDNIQRVKMADEKFDKIITIKSNVSEKRAIVEYNTIRDTTPFVLNRNGKITVEKRKKAYFYLTDQGWQIIDQNDALMMNF